MTENPTTVDLGDTVGEAAALLQTLEIRHLPVLDGRQLVGMLSDRDLRGIYTTAAAGGASLDEVRERFLAPVSGLMSADVVRTHPEASLSEVIELMLEHRIGAIPVVDPGTDDLVGIVSYVDVLRAAHDELGE
jgi:acetoin utilization protein AcuB